MEFFNEVKNRYFHIALKVINECENGLSRKDIIKIVDGDEFKEKVIDKDFQTFEGYLLNEYEDENNFNFLKIQDGSYYPSVSKVPVRLTNNEKIWLKNLLNVQDLKLILDESTILKLNDALSDIEGPDFNEIIEQTNKSILPEIKSLEQYETNFRIILKAIKDGKNIIYTNTDRMGNKYYDQLARPLRFEYSVKDSRVRVCMHSIAENRSIMANIFSLTNIQICEEDTEEITRETAIKMIHKEKYSEEPIVLEVIDQKCAMERCFMSFSEMERFARCIDKDKYEIKLYYYTFDEEEVIRKILSIGPYVKVISPKRIVDKVIQKIRSALVLNECNNVDKEGNRLVELKGKYSTAKVYCDKLEPEVITQIIELCNQDFCRDSKIAIMPDTHAGKGCAIGFTADLGDKVIPNIVGVDIGCGMLTVELGNIDIDLKELDDIINKYVPSRRNVHEGRVVKFPRLQELNCYRELKASKRIERSIGTLGGGNHFIEVNIDEEKKLYLVIHSGSRNLGTQVAEHYQNLAIDICAGKEDYYIKREQLIAEYKRDGKRKLIQQDLMKLKKEYEDMIPEYPKELCFLTGRFREEYLSDMNICQEYAVLNRITMANIILGKLLNKSIQDFSYFNTTHNYINFKDNIIRKGSISAYEGEKVLIPINMRDGSILAVGRGNPDWNYSAPHGAGRLMSRTKAKASFTLEEYQKSMEGIFTTSVNEATLDEAPMAYKPIEEIINNIGDTVEILKVIKPIYNFKAGE